jgi:hypothetical protein
MAILDEAKQPGLKVSDSGRVRSNYRLESPRQRCQLESIFSGRHEVGFRFAANLVLSLQLNTGPAIHPALPSRPRKTPSCCQRSAPYQIG